MGEQHPIRSERLYEGKVVSLRRDTRVMDKAGKPLEVTHEVAEHNSIVVMVPVDTEGNMLLVRQYRHPTGEVLLEVPAGTMEQGENPEETALRELQEETGHSARQMTRIGGFWIAPGWSTEYAHVFLCAGLQPAPAEPDEDEDIQVVTVPVERIPELIQRGEVRDAKSIAALLMALSLFREEVSKARGAGPG